ncbi:MAG: tetratricopeptide repeat protein [Anaerolineae bacterium]|nr:MAG: tetratricopeptide repeat protein [Anaerolineae bacterium]
MQFFKVLNDDRMLKRLVLLMAIAVGLVFLSFGSYYYWDRYVRIGDQSPLERDIAALEEAVREDPQDPERRVALAEYYLGKGLYAEALKQANEVLKAFPDNDRAMLVKGIAYVRTGDYQNAIEPLQGFIDLRKDSPMANTDIALETAYYFLGESYMALEQPENAIEPLEAAIKIERTDADALYQLGVAYIETGQPETALPYLERAVRLVPDFTEAYTAMIDVYTAEGKSDYVAFARGMQAFSLGDYETAQVHLEHATQALPEFAPAFVGLAMTYEKQGNLDAAMQAAETAVQLAPEDFSAQQTYGRLQAASQP